MMPASQPPCALVNDHASMNCGSRAGTREYPAKPRISAAQTPATRTVEIRSVADCFSEVISEHSRGSILVAKERWLKALCMAAKEGTPAPLPPFGIPPPEPQMPRLRQHDVTDALIVLWRRMMRVKTSRAI